MEFSTNTDTESLEEFLKVLSGRIERFGEAQVAEVMNRTRALALDATTTFSFPVAFEGRPGTLRIELFMDDVDAPDAYFFGPAPLIHAIEREWEDFL